jgi:hypothetical protein
MNFVYFYPRFYYERKMSMGRVLYGEAVQRRFGVKFKWWGPGWEGYDQTKSVTENLLKLDWEPDVLWFYKAEGLIGVKEAPGVKLVCFNEANDPKTLKEIDEACADVVVFHHESDMGRWDIPQKKVHQLHCVSPEFFEDISIEDRQNDCMLTGAIAESIYPVRARFQNLIQNGDIPGLIRKHPGYRLAGRQACTEQYMAYCAHLCRSKISLCCTSIYKYPLAKILESMAAGCLVVSDMPDDEEFKGNLGSYVVDVGDLDSKGTADSINGMLYNWGDPLIGEMAAGGRDAVLSKYTTSNYATGIIEGCRELTRS